MAEALLRVENLTKKFESQVNDAATEKEKQVMDE